AHDIAEKSGLDWQILLAFDLAANPVALELGEDFVEAGRGQIHLIERLHGGQPCRAALVGFARVLVGGRRVAGHHFPASERLSATMASAALAAAAPLLRSSSPARARA